MTPIRDQLYATALKFLQAQSCLEADRMTALRTPTCRSTGMAPSRTTSKTCDQLKPLLEDYKRVFKDAKYSLLEENDMVIDEWAKKVTMRVRGQFETCVGPWANDFVFILTMTEDGKLLADIKSFPDTAALEELETRVLQASQAPAPWLAHMIKADA
ncbi:uncharacterized protein BHQ10_009281 [Talaromyces amestolkiae]|uniref:SnoaL-like domain-containing protein n=1 Tax=Talaromyces amestolkiae TaxID=1196081 RepID=A0A364LBW5_TALAM|nr:uncharacterized protein BHQ10_009281 [Talaromyces amestolkiae]RAO73269.1 hypothetical protein BHQ10_009281 [Talaromyces amestolkiae]